MAVTLKRTLSAERQRLKIHVNDNSGNNKNKCARHKFACCKGLWMDISITMSYRLSVATRTLSRAIRNSISLRLSNLLIIVAVVHVAEHTLL